MCIDRALHETDAVSRVMVLVATVAMVHHLHMRPRDDHLLDLRQL